MFGCCFGLLITFCLAELFVRLILCVFVFDVSCCLLLVGFITCCLLCFDEFVIWVVCNCFCCFCLVCFVVSLV